MPLRPAEAICGAQEIPETGILPDGNAALRVCPHAVARLNVVGLIELGNRLQNAVAAKLVGRMNVHGCQILAHLPRGGRCPGVCHGTEELVEVRIRFLLCRGEDALHCAEVRDVFRNRQHAAARNAGADLLPVVPVRNLQALLLERGVILLGPPVGSVAVFIELCTVVVKGVRDLMGNDVADAAEVFPLSRRSHHKAASAELPPGR